MRERTEEDALLQEPFKAMLCGQETVIPLLKLGASIKWKNEHWFPIMFGESGWQRITNTVEELKAKNADAAVISAAVKDGFHFILIGQVEQVYKAVLAYLNAAGLTITEEELLTKANEAEITELWLKIDKFASPLVTSLAEMKQKKK